MCLRDRVDRFRKVRKKDTSIDTGHNIGHEGENSQGVTFEDDLAHRTVSENGLERNENSDVNMIVDITLDSMEINSNSSVKRVEPSIEQDEIESLNKNDKVPNKTLVVSELRKWIIKSNIPRITVDSLLKIIRPIIPEIPACVKTLLRLKPDLKFKIETYTDGSQFVYFGIEKNLQNIVNVDLHQDDTLFLQFHFDGLSLFRSSNTEFWPILGKIYMKGRPFIYKPFIVATNLSNGKPTCIQNYLKQYVDELSKLRKHGIKIENRVFKIHARIPFIGDKPARSFIKCVKGHGGFCACERCAVVGER